MSKANKVEIQKGKIISNPPTMQQMTYNERVGEAKRESALRRSGQTTTLHEPKTSRK